MNTEQNQFNVWDAKEFFKLNNTLPSMSEDDKKTLKQFAKYQVSDAIEAYERYTYNHGGQGQEAKNILSEIVKSEALVKILRETEN